MRKLFAIVGLMFAAIAWPAIAQTGAAVVGKGPGVAGAAKTVKITATVSAINAASRTLTLKGPQDREIRLNVGPEVKNFEQLKVGDQVNAEYYEALTLELKKGSTVIVSRTDQTGMGKAKPGARPAVVAGRRVTVTAEVIDVDAKTQTVTLRGPRRTVELKIPDPAQFKRVAKGDHVEATYTQALAVTVEPVKK